MDITNNTTLTSKKIHIGILCLNKVQLEINFLLSGSVTVASKFEYSEAFKF